MRGSINLVDKKKNPNQLTFIERERLLAFTSEGFIQSYKDELKKAAQQGNRKRWNALRVKTNRLRRFCLKVIAERGDGFHKRLGVMISEGVEDFMNGWESTNVSLSEFVKPVETETFNTISV
jgi:hypothetical protein